jgi:hypothetical protein
VHMLFADRAGCGEYLVLGPARAVNARPELGVRCTTADHLPADATETVNGYSIRSITPPRDVDVIVFQRPMRAAMIGAMKWLAQRRPDIALVVEIDDDLLAIPTSNSAFMRLQPKVNHNENIGWLREALHLADMITVSTPELKSRYGMRTPAVAVRNAIPRSVLSQPARTLSRGRKVAADADENRVIGWAGWTGTHAADPLVTSGALADVVGVPRDDDRTISFRNIGPGDGVAGAFGLESELAGATGWLPLDLYRAGMGQLDVGIVPLEDTRFNRSKSFLKAIEFAAAAVPVVVSDTPEHRYLRDNGMPLMLATRRREWVKALRSLVDLDDEGLRDLAVAHRENVRLYHTIEGRVEDWTSAWKRAADLGARRRATSA